MYTILFSVHSMNFTETNYNKIVNAITEAVGEAPKYCDRENFPFGFAPRFIFENSEPMYIVGKNLYTWEEMRAHLRDTWRPVNTQEQDYFCSKIA